MQPRDSHLSSGGGFVGNVTEAFEPLEVVRTAAEIAAGAVDRVTEHHQLYPPGILEMRGINASRCRPTEDSGRAWLDRQQSAALEPRSRKSPEKKQKTWTCSGVALEDCLRDDDTAPMSANTTAAFVDLSAEAEANFRLAAEGGGLSSGAPILSDGAAATTGVLYTKRVSTKGGVRKMTYAWHATLKPVDHHRLLVVAADEASTIHDIKAVCSDLGISCSATAIPGFEPLDNRQLSKAAAAARAAANTRAVRLWAVQQARLPPHKAENLGELMVSALMRPGPNGGAVFNAGGCVSRDGNAPTGTNPYGRLCTDCILIKKRIRDLGTRRAAACNSLAASPTRPHAALMCSPPPGAPPGNAAVVNRLREQSGIIKRLKAKNKALQHNLDALTHVLESRSDRCTPVSTTSSIDVIRGVAASYQMLDSVGPGGKLLVDTTKSAATAPPRNPGMETDASLLDEAFPPGSLARAYIDTSHRNVMSQIKNGSRSGFRYDPQVQHLALQLCQKAGKTMYTEMSKVLPGLPSYRSMTDAKNFLSPDETGPLTSVLESMRYTYDRKGIKEGDADMVGVLSTDELHMEGGWAWSAATKTILGQGTLDEQLMLMKSELDREYNLKVERATGNPSDRPADPNIVATK